MRAPATDPSPGGTGHTLVVRDLSAGYRGVPVVRELNLEVRPGEVVAPRCRVAWNSRRSWPNGAGPSRAATARRSASAASCCRAGRWACQSVVGADVVTADGRLIRADAGQNSDLLWAARGAGPGFPGVITRFRLQTYPAPRAMWHDTWTIRLDDTVRLLGWLHDVLPGLDRRVEPVVAATRLPDVPLHDGADRPDGTVLLLHTTVMADSDAEALALLAPLQDGPLAGRELGHVQGRTSVLEENAAQTAQNPEGHRYAVDCTWTDASAAVLAPMLQALWSELDTEHSFSIWYGWVPRGSRPDMAFSVEANVYVATYAIYTDPADDARYSDWVHRRTAELAAACGTGVYLGDTDFTRRQDRFMSDDAYRRLTAIRAERDPDGRIASYLTSDAEGLNVHG